MITRGSIASSVKISERRGGGGNLDILQKKTFFLFCPGSGGFYERVNVCNFGANPRRGPHVSMVVM